MAAPWPRRLAIGLLVLSLCLLSPTAWAQPATAPELPLILPTGQPQRTLVVRGLWHEHYALEAGLAMGQSGLLTDVWAWDGMGFGWPGPGNQGEGGLSGFPGETELLRHSLVLIPNVNAKSLRPRQALLERYLRAGGAILFLGGRWAFGQQWAESPLAELVPVRFAGKGRWRSDLRQAAAGEPMRPAPGAWAERLAELDWAAAPRVYWWHQATVVEGAEVVLRVDDEPLLVLGQVGQGRVAVFLGTVMGEPGADQTAFWAWRDWPRLQALINDWLLAAPAAAPHGLTADQRRAFAARLAQLAPSDLEGTTGESGPLRALVTALAARIYDRESADWFYAQLAQLPVDLPAELPGPLAEQTRHLAHAGWAAPAEKLLASGRWYQTALGARLLGLSQAAGAEARLAVLLRQPKLADKGAKKDEFDLDKGLAGMPDEGAVLPAEAERRTLTLQVAALAALGDLADQRGLPALRASLKEFSAAGAIKPGTFLDILPQPAKLYQQNLLSLLRQGEASAAEPLITALLENTYIAARARSEGNKSKDLLAKAQDLIPATLAWQDHALGQLHLAHPATLPALVKRLASEPDPRGKILSLALFAGKPVGK